MTIGEHMITSNLTMLILFSMIYILGLIYIYFSRERATNTENKIYKIMLVSNLVGLLLQFISDYVSQEYYSLPYLLPHAIVKLFLIYFIFWAICVLIYLVMISFKNYTKFIYAMIVVFILTSTVVLLLPQSFYIDEINRIYYSYGPSVQFTYFFSGIITTIIGILLILKRKVISKKKTIPLYFFLIFGIIGMIVQINYPELVITAAVESYICCLMYFTIENPDIKMIQVLNLAKDQADKANRAKTDFLSSMSHEIRTPLNAIVGFSECIKTENDIEEARKDADDIIMASQNLLEIVNGILDISKIEANKMEIVNSNYELLPNLENLSKLILPRLDEKPVEFTTNFSEDLPHELYGDIGKLKQIITNLLTNAAKYTHEGKISFNVSCINEGEYTSLVLSIEDTGRGIKPEQIDKLFTKFNRLDEDRNTTAEGTGLGLAITKSLVEMMGGKIVVQSVYGEGSKFTVYVKQKIVEMAGENPVKVEENSQNLIFANSTILIVDDNKLNLKVAEKVLQPYKVKTELIDNGFDCIKLISSGKTYDLILLDDMMPKMRGTETLTKLREIPNFNIPTIVLTANAVGDVRDSYIKMGFNDYLAKPIEKEELKRVLSNYLKPSGMEVPVAPVIETTAKRSTAISDFSGKKVLIVDDNKMNLRIARNFLAPYKFDLTEVESGLECLKLITEGKEFDMIFMDDMMPQMTGTQTMEKLKSMGAKLPIVVLTANAIDGAKENYLRKGFDDYISKPIMRTELDRIIRKSFNGDREKLATDDIKYINEDDVSCTAYPKKVETKGNIDYLQNSNIDVCNAMNILGSIEIYDETLKTFYEEIDKKIERFRKLASEKDIDNYQKDIVALRSDAKYLGFNEIFDQCYKQQVKLNENNIIEFSNVIATMLTTVKATVSKYL